MAPGPVEKPSATLSDEEAWAEFERLTGADGLTRREAVNILARRHERPARDVYTAIERGKRAARTAQPLP
jgi:hypothetical protein